MPVELIIPPVIILPPVMLAVAVIRPVPIFPIFAFPPTLNTPAVFKLAP